MIRAIRFFSWPGFGGWFLSVFFASVAGAATPSAVILSWDSSPDPNVTGYYVYYGTTSGVYTNTISVVNVTNVSIYGLIPGTTYYFAATAHDGSGHESPPSNETVFFSITISPGGHLLLKTLATNLGGDPVAFNLAPGAPPAATINPATGILSWTPGRADAFTTNYFNVFTADENDPAVESDETIVVTVDGCTELTFNPVAVLSGQAAGQPVVLVSGGGTTNFTFTLNWPGGQLLNPILTPASGVNGSLQNQNTNLVITLWTPPGAVLTGTNLVAQINFQAAAGQPSAFLDLQVTSAAGTESDATSSGDILAGDSEIVIVGDQPLLRPQTSAAGGRSLTIYANPGKSYQVQYATNLTPPIAWRPLQNFQPADVIGTISLDAAGPVDFYRLQQE